MGESYLVTNIVSGTTEEEAEYNDGKPLEKIKLRVFSVSKSD
jgi:hypothetical protein